MAKTIAVINQKGGVGKSTTAATLWAGLSLKGHKALAVDLDSQCNLSFCANAGQEGITSFDLLMGTATAQQAIQHLPQGDCIAGSTYLGGLEPKMEELKVEPSQRLGRLKQALKPIAGQYDFVLIDTPPQLGLLTLNALMVCEKVVVPAQADILSLHGIEQLAGTMDTVKAHNKALSIMGLLLTRYSPRSILSRDVAEMAGQLAKNLQTKLFKATIREAVAIREAQISQQSLFEYAPSSQVAKDYMDFVEEFLEEARNG